MVNKQPTRPLSKLNLFWKLVLVLSLWQFAFSQPLLDLLGRTPEFFVAHDAQALDLILFALLCIFAVPAVFCGSLWLIRRLHEKSFDMLYILLLGAMFFLITLPHTHFIEQYHPYLTVVGALFAAALLTALIVRNAMVQDFSKYLALAVIAVPLNFLFLSPVEKLLSADTSTLKSEEDPHAAPMHSNTAVDTPVVLLLFDALPLSSLMTVEENIDGERFPAFAELASTATWYRNAITLSDSTFTAVPSVLAGTMPQKGKLPTAEDYPGNLFMVLHGSAELFVHEPLTSLCPLTLCPDMAGDSFGQRFPVLLNDSIIAYYHYLLPTFLKGGLPSIEEQWRGFGTEEDASSGNVERREQKIVSEGRNDVLTSFRTNIAQIKPREGKAFYFQHLMVPHVPWRYVPSGREYEITQEAGLASKGTWGSNEWLITQSYQRHLLQLGAVDGFVGELLARLKSQGLFEKALVIVTADHGASYYAGLKKRTLQLENRVDVGNIPLLVKYPDQSTAKVVDGLARSIDIAPTIAAVLGLPSTVQMDGMDLRSMESGVLDSVQVHRFEQPLATITPEDLRSLRQRTIIRKESLFPHRGQGPDDWFYPATAFDSIVGRTVDKLALHAKGNVLKAIVWRAGDFQNLDLTQQVLPLRTMGRLQGLSVTDAALPLAIALNGRVAAITWSYTKDDAVLFSAMLPESYLKAGNNTLAVYAIGHDGGDFVSLTLLGES